MTPALNTVPPLIVPNSWPQTPSTSHIHPHISMMNGHGRSPTPDSVISDDGFGPILSHNSSPQALTSNDGNVSPGLDRSPVDLSQWSRPRSLEASLDDEDDKLGGKGKKEMEEAVTYLPPKLRSPYKVNVPCTSVTFRNASQHKYCWAHAIDEASLETLSLDNDSADPEPIRSNPADAFLNGAHRSWSPVAEQFTEEPHTFTKPPMEACRFLNPSPMFMSVRKQSLTFVSNSRSTPENRMGIDISEPPLLQEHVRASDEEPQTRIRKTSLSNIVHDHQKDTKFTSSPSLLGGYDSISSSAPKTTVRRQRTSNCDENDYLPLRPTTTKAKTTFTAAKANLIHDRRANWRSSHPSESRAGRPTKHAQFLVKPESTPNPLPADSRCNPKQIGTRWLCNKCPQDFNRRADCNRHFLSAHVFLSHRCEVCDKEFTRSDAKVRHLKVQHDL
ncbi:hypothetical protein DL96DRAFT_1557836 [Flagelloscypha sp. PMI_526]|nr:hypothetical protein DL96DRAFT_1557836 [Flagelloscypha sp. PMI_526]